MLGRFNVKCGNRRHHNNPRRRRVGTYTKPLNRGFFIELLNERPTDTLSQNSLSWQGLLKGVHLMTLCKFLCKLFFHEAYYKYGEYRSITYNTNPPSASSGPEHLGWHCRHCEMFLGWKIRNGSYWFQIEIPRK